MAAPANFLAALTKFGAKTALMGKVGADTFGRLLTGTLRKAGIETGGLVAADDVFTTLAFVTLDKTGNREFSFSRKPGADTCLTTEELDLSLIDQTRVFHFGTLSLTDEPARSATCRAVEYAKAGGKLITFDPNLRKPLWRDLEEAKRQMIWGLTKAASSCKTRLFTALAISMSNFVWYVKTSGTCILSRRARASAAGPALAGRCITSPSSAWTRRSPFRA